MMRFALLTALVCGFGLPTLEAQYLRADNRSPMTADVAFQQQRSSFMHGIIHTGKWLTAAAAIGFTVMASTQHNYSSREWDALLELCRSAQDACLRGPNGRYLRADAEALFQRSRHYDVVANRWLVSAQLSLVTTTALFIIDLNAGGGPENIPYPSEIRVGAVGGGPGVAIGYRLPAIR